MIAPRRAFSLVEMVVMIGILAVLFALVLPAIQSARALAARVGCASNLHQVGSAVLQYREATSFFPPGVTSDQPGRLFARMSWLARILPYLGEDKLWQATVAAYKAEPTGFINPPHMGLSYPLQVLACPSDERVLTPQTTSDGDHVALTSYLGVVGIDYLRKDGVLYVDSRIKLGDISDGTSSTVIVGERPPSPDFVYGWWYAGDGQAFSGTPDMLLGTNERNVPDDDRLVNCTPGPYMFRAGSLDQQCDVFHYWSLHPGGAHFLFADGSVRFLSYGADSVLPALATRAGGEVIPAFD